jgi:hypothetical protein
MSATIHYPARRAALLCVLLLSVASCSSIINGSKQQITVNSEPPDAEIMLNGSFAGRTPAQFEVKRGKNHMIEIKKEGFQTARVMTDKSFEALVILNIFVWPGFIVDLATGSAWGVDPEIIHVSLDKMGAN